ncbi:MAG: sulfotransferase, partial [Phycisphaerales bacterium]|nr:sulfotransferase [Phycisphaerales bacterium]
DKMPNNHRQVGLMLRLFPDAPIIHCTRDPLDTCLSIWFQLFAGGVPFSNDLRHIGAYHRQYERLMAHWTMLFGGRILEANYETIVRDQEAQTRRLLEYCHLDFEDACLRFHESKRVTITASNQQVRQPMYSSSVARHERYGAHLAPLRDALQGS